MKQTFLTLLVVLTCYPTPPASAEVRDGGEPPRFGLWAAAAFSRSKAGSRMDPVGRAFGERTEYTAKSMALRACGNNDCEIKTYVDTGCVGIAHGFAPDLREWWGFGAGQYGRRRDQTVNQAKAYSRKSAGEAAKSACDSAARSNCSISEIFCTWDTEDSGDATAEAAEWIRGMGGDFSYGARSVVYLVNITTQAYMINLGLTYNKSMCARAQRWARLTQLVRECNFNTGDLDRLYADATKYSGVN